MARKSYLRVAGVIENMSAFTCDHGETYALFGTGGGADAGRRDRRAAARPGAARAGGGGRRRRRRAGRAGGDGPAADAFRAIADRIVTEIVPPVDMAGCSARLLDAVEKALGPV